MQDVIINKLYLKSRQVAAWVVCFCLGRASCLNSSNEIKFTWLRMGLRPWQKQDDLGISSLYFIMVWGVFNSQGNVALTVAPGVNMHYN